MIKINVYSYVWPLWLKALVLGFLNVHFRASLEE